MSMSVVATAVKTQWFPVFIAQFHLLSWRIFRVLNDRIKLSPGQSRHCMETTSQQSPTNIRYAAGRAFSGPRRTGGGQEEDRMNI